MRIILLAVVSVFIAALDCRGEPVMKDGLSLRKFIDAYGKSERKENITRSDETLVAEGTGYIQGVIDSYFVGLQLGHKCPYKLPQDIKLQKAIEAVGNYLEKHPDKVNGPAAMLVPAGLMEAYPDRDFSFKRGN